ncbi:cell division protein FtsA [Aneurinibacillus sp. Ricciae_BoGa-3]|uniref:cell division protein FtsA n=1 Tax=Aneurinibacillus sp. Ricciae_BoGa-3 TaxID=3022697 RepID=UPI00233F90DF|nr:cell division protein FtsA [Aneurinibacillus sp. Ricciae_BoGa-3]WCK55762.1 cell division protein FtsA [Aneurinibacillus sp. Ricciae_BoGa-3]
MTENNKYIFALDIGTRSVVGLLAEPDGDKFRVASYAREEHAERSMLDGQIHDVVKVADVINRVKTQLELESGETLTHVAVAAAGRSLHTDRAQTTVDISARGQLKENDIIALELAAIQQAQHSLANKRNDHNYTEYYCVGYSVVNYFLDREIIGNLVDQRGKEAGVDIIATFLPRVVVDSLIAALSRSGLEMQALTLEPIAAINVLVPSTMRRLNVALVDIGAGTSDIAITGEGTVSAYGMVPTAGDEITEALSEAFLLDFPVAETVKRQLSDREEVTFSDILGMEYTCTRDEIIEKIEPEINRLAALISERILELNGRAPQAVMMIGGGSLTPALASKVAERLELPAARAAVRGAEAIQSYTDRADLNGPEFVTPLGIAVAANRHPIKYLTIDLNGEQLRIFDLKEMTLGEVLLYGGVDIKRMHGRPGMAMTISVNGRMKIIPGQHGTAPVLVLNGEPAQLDAIIKPGDSITFETGCDGLPAAATSSTIMEEVSTLDVFVNGTPFNLPPYLKVNGQDADWDRPLSDRDEIEFFLPKTVRQVLQAAELLHPDMNMERLSYTVNGKPHAYPYSLYSFWLNGHPAALDDKLGPKDALTYEHQTPAPPTVGDVLPVEDLTNLATQVTFNGEAIRIPCSEMQILLDGEPVDTSHPIHSNATIVVEVHFKRDAVFSDAFRYVKQEIQSFDAGKTLVTTINGEPASFNDPVKTGDILELRWK